MLDNVNSKIYFIVQRFHNFKKKCPEEEQQKKEKFYQIIIVWWLLKNATKKGVAQKIFYSSLDRLQTKAKGDILEIFQTAIDNAPEELAALSIVFRKRWKN